MNGEANLIPEVIQRDGMDFNDFMIGEGYVDAILEVRVKISDDSYIHVNDNQVEVNTTEDWPLSHRVKIRYFKIIVKEI